MDRTKRFPLFCECGTHVLELIAEFEDKYITLLVGIRSSQRLDFKERLKIIWCVIRKKDYMLYDIIILEDQWKEFQKFVADN